MAAEYLAWCPIHGESALRTLLRSVPMTGGDQRLARHALRLARTHDLHDIAAGEGRINAHLLPYTQKDADASSHQLLKALGSSACS